MAGEAKTVEQWLQKSSDYLGDARKANAAGLQAIAFDQFGYCVEAKAKAVVMRRRGFTEWVHGKVPAPCFTHSIETLVRQANLGRDLGQDLQANSRLRSFWLVMKDWRPIRYRIDKPSEQVIMEIEQAITDEPDGILRWLDKHL